MSRRILTTIRAERASRTDASSVRVEGIGLDGYVRTPHGYAIVYSAPRMFMTLDDGRQYLGPCTRIRVMHGGTGYTLSYSRMLTRVGAARIATRFARDVAAGKYKAAEATRARRATGRAGR